MPVIVTLKVRASIIDWKSAIVDTLKIKVKKAAQLKV